MVCDGRFSTSLISIACYVDVPASQTTWHPEEYRLFRIGMDDEREEGILAQLFFKLTASDRIVSPWIKCIP
jgi:hypothetical protein